MLGIKVFMKLKFFRKYWTTGTVTTGIYIYKEALKNFSTALKCNQQDQNPMTQVKSIII